MAYADKRIILGIEMKLLYEIYIIVALFTAQHQEGLKTLGEISHWHFELDGRAIDVKLSSYAHAHRPNATNISYTFAPNKSPISAHEEAEVLGKVLQEMKSSGYDPEGLAMISFPLEGTTLKEGIDHAVSNSSTWRSCIGRKYCQEAKSVADQYLASTNALRELDERLQASGLQIVRVATDDVACKLIRDRTVHSNGSPGKAQMASCGGLVYIETQKKEKTRGRQATPSTGHSGIVVARSLASSLAQSNENTSGFVRFSIHFATGTATGHIALFKNGAFREPTKDDYTSDSPGRYSVNYMEYWRMQ